MVHCALGARLVGQLLVLVKSEAFTPLKVEVPRGMSELPIFIMVTVMTWLLPTGVPGKVKLAGEKLICTFVE